MSRTFYNHRIGETSFSMFKPGEVHISDSRPGGESAVVPVADLRDFLAWFDSKAKPKPAGTEQLRLPK